MPVNEIKQFGAAGTVANGDVMDLTAYDADPQRLTGNQAGIARRELVNTVLRQVSHMAAGLAQFVDHRSMTGVYDDGDLDALEAAIDEAITAMIAEAVPTVGAATAEAAGLVELATPAETVAGEDAVRAVTPAGLTEALAARGAWTGNMAETGWVRMPNGLILQWGQTVDLQSDTSLTVILPITYPNRAVLALAGVDRDVNINGVLSAYAHINSPSQITVVHDAVTTAAVQPLYWFTVGY